MDGGTRWIDWWPLANKMILNLLLPTREWPFFLRSEQAIVADGRWFSDFCPSQQMYSYFSFIIDSRYEMKINEFPTWTCEMAECGGHSIRIGRCVDR